MSWQSVFQENPVRRKHLWSAKDRWVRYDFDGSRTVKRFEGPITKKSLRKVFVRLRVLKDNQISLDRQRGGVVFVDINEGSGWEPFATIS
jgi:hypothetical protein